MDELDDPGQDCRVGIGGDSMPQVENMAGRHSARRNHFAYPLGHHRPGSRQQRRIEVALEGIAMADATTSLSEWQAPIHTDDLCAGGAHQAEELRGANAEVNARHSGISQRLQHSGRVGLGISTVVLDTEAAGPGVEQLDYSGAGRHLCRQEHSGQIGQLSTHRMPQGRLADH